MRDPNHKVDKYRLPGQGPYPSTKKGDAFGLFLVPFLAPFREIDLHIISSGPDQPTGWEHVSVSLDNRCPTWPEMCYVKKLFWYANETVIQFHPAAASYKNEHEYCLHLWRQVGVNAPLPPLDCV